MVQNALILCIETQSMYKVTRFDHDASDLFLVET
jgi:hypothetical protein